VPGWQTESPHALLPSPVLGVQLGLPLDPPDEPPDEPPDVVPVVLLEHAKASVPATPMKQSTTVRSMGILRARC
jgi:hypothetical protein